MASAKNSSSHGSVSRGKTRSFGSDATEQTSSPPSSPFCLVPYRGPARPKEDPTSENELVFMSGLKPPAVFDGELPVAFRKGARVPADRFNIDEQKVGESTPIDPSSKPDPKRDSSPSENPWDYTERPVEQGKDDELRYMRNYFTRRETEMLDLLDLLSSFKKVAPPSWRQNLARWLGV